MDVGIAPTWIYGMTSGGTNLPATELGMTRWFESKSSDTGEREVKSVNVVSFFRGIFWDNDSMNDDSTSESESSVIN